MKFYLLTPGFLDGVPGSAHVVIGCKNTFHKYLKLIELEKTGSAARGKQPRRGPAMILVTRGAGCIGANFVLEGSPRWDETVV